MRENQGLVRETTHPRPLQVFASGKDVVIVDKRLAHVQTVLGSDCGYGDTRINCVHCAEAVGKIAVAWGNDVVIFKPEPLDDGNDNGMVCSCCVLPCLHVFVFRVSEFPCFYSTQM